MHYNLAKMKMGNVVKATIADLIRLYPMVGAHLAWVGCKELKNLAAYTNPATGRISMDPNVMNEYNRAQVRHVTAHEFGHMVAAHIAYRGGKIIMDIDTPEQVSPQAAINSLELFCELFAFDYMGVNKPWVASLPDFIHFT